MCLVAAVTCLVLEKNSRRDYENHVCSPLCWPLRAALGGWSLGLFPQGGRVGRQSSEWGSSRARLSVQGSVTGFHVERLCPWPSGEAAFPSW